MTVKLNAPSQHSSPASRITWRMTSGNDTANLLSDAAAKAGASRTGRRRLHRTAAVGACNRTRYASLSGTWRRTAFPHAAGTIAAADSKTADRLSAAISAAKLGILWLGTFCWRRRFNSPAGYGNHCGVCAFLPQRTTYNSTAGSLQRKRLHSACHCGAPARCYRNRSGVCPGCAALLNKKHPALSCLFHPTDTRRCDGSGVGCCAGIV